MSCWMPAIRTAEGAVYLARLVRDLPMPLAPIVDQLLDDEDHAFENALEVLEVLGRAGVDEAVEAVRRYIRDGERWIAALETVARAWPVAWWDDLRPAVSDRIGPLATHDRVWISQPWTTWADRDERIAALVRPSEPDSGPRRRFAAQPAQSLLAVLRQPGREDDWRDALRELRLRPPEPELLDLAEALAVSKAVGPLRGAITAMGEPALPAARRWAEAGDHPLTWTGLRLLAAHGGTADVPALIAGLDRLDADPDDRCGYDELATGLARIGGPTATAVLPRLYRLWFSPHSFERAAYLRAMVTLDPPGTRPLLVEGLWDCESDVRLLATQQTPMDAETRERLEYLRDDPIETPEVRRAAGERLG